MDTKTRIVSGFVVGSTELTFCADGSTRSRPKLLEHERVATGDSLWLSIGSETIHLDREQADALKLVLDSFLDEED